MCVPGYGKTARELARNCQTLFNNMDVKLVLTKMASMGMGTIDTNLDLEAYLETLLESNTTKVIFLTNAVVDFGRPDGDPLPPRASTREQQELILKLKALPKVVETIRKTRKDIFLVACKQTFGLSDDEMYIAGLELCKRASCNLVLVNDKVRRQNMIVTPEEARYHVTTNRHDVLWNLAEMAYLRSHMTFTRSTVVDGKPIPWNSDLVPDALRRVVDYCIERGAYKPFRGSTAGHFACKLNETTFLTSIRKTDFNDLDKNGLVKVVTDGPDSVMAYGAKPSVGGQSQRIVFHEHQEYDCIVHFHCPIKEGSLVPVASQRAYECGSHACGQNTSSNLKRFGNLSAVYLDQHGPNIVFHKSIDPMEVIAFIEANFDLEQKTGGFVSLNQIRQTPSTLETAKEIL